MPSGYAEALAEAGPDALVLRHCRACDRAHWYPRAKCPLCHAFDTEWRAAPPLGEVHACTTMRQRGTPVFGLATVTLDAGPLVFVRLEPDEAQQLQVGDRIRLAAAPADEAGTGKGALRYVGRTP